MIRMNDFNIRRCANILRQLAVEPIILLSFVATEISLIVIPVGIYKVVCLKTFASNPEIDCDHLSNATINGSSAEILVQRSVATWNMAMGIATLAPAFIADIFLGAYGDRRGRKVNMLLGIAGNMFKLYPAIVLFAYPLLAPMYILVIGHLIAGFSGSLLITLISSMAYLADTSADRRGLSSRMALVSIVVSASHIIGPFVVGVTGTVLTRPYSLLLSQCILLIAFVLCLWRIRHVPPAQMRRLVMEREGGKPAQSENTAVRENSTEPSDKTEANTTKENDRSLCISVIDLLKDSWRMFTRKREGNARLYLIVAAFLLFLNSLSELGIKITIFPLYVQKAPLNWNQNMIGYFKSIQGAMLVIGTMLGVLIFQKIFKLSDTFVVLIAALSHIAENLIMAFASKTWLVFAAAAVSSAGQLAVPCMQAFIAEYVGPDEVGKAYTAFGMAVNVAMLISSALYNTMYSSTLIIFPGFVYLFAVFVQVLIFCALVWLHVDSSFKRLETTDSVYKKLIRSMFRSDIIDKTSSQKLELKTTEQSSAHLT